MDIRWMKARAGAGAALALGLLLGGMAGCRQTLEGGEDGSPAKADPGNRPLAPTSMSGGEGRLLEGKSLETFLAQTAKEIPLPAAPEGLPDPGGLAKAAAYADCNINFNSYSSLSRLPDKASAFYTLAPWYSMYCAPYTTFVTPTTYQYYYLVPEATGVCSGKPGFIGYGTDVLNCKNQQDAALFPRRAGNGSTTDGTLGVRVTMQNSTSLKNFQLKSFVGWSGTITVYAYREGIGWWYWGPLPSNNTYWTFSNAENVREVKFHSSNNQVFYVDNIVVTPL